ncbi:MAG: hypothetical protein HUK14_04215 [Muribaculaceae bacterium]|nr:hypothetical protein [Muribaculaceae bacterium]
MADNPQMLLEQYSQVLSGNSFMLLYQMSHFCTKADLLLLLGLEIEANGAIQKIEDVCKVMQVDDYTFGFIPNRELLAPQITLAIAKDHPEFKIERKMFDGTNIEDVNEENEKSDSYIKIITAKVPDVNKDRHDVLLEGIKVLYEANKATFEWNLVEYTKKLENSMEGADLESKKVIMENFENTTKQYEEIRDGYYTKKQDEIEQAYAHYCETADAQEQEAAEKKKAEGFDAAQSLNMFDSLNE